MGEATLPLRPLTVGELLDAAFALLRRVAVPLLSVSAVLAVLEQLLLWPLRDAVQLPPPTYLSPDWIYARFTGFLLLLAVGAGTEAFAITLLGGLAARHAVPALLGGAAEDRSRPRAGRVALLAAVALVIAVLATASTLAGFVAAPFWLMITGLIGPVLMVDRRPARQLTRPLAALGSSASRAFGPLAAAGRGFGLVFRSGLRPGMIRLLNYLAWLLIRLAFGYAVFGAAGYVFNRLSQYWLGVLVMAGFAVVNTLAYAAAGCVDAVAHLETRIRLEGLDIAVGVARRAGLPVRDELLVPAKQAKHAGQQVGPPAGQVGYPRGVPIPAPHLAPGAQTALYPGARPMPPAVP